MPKSKILLKIFYAFLFIIIAIGCFSMTILAVYVYAIINEKNIDLDLDTITLNYTSIIYAEDSETGEYFELQRIHGRENRIWVNFDQISPHLINASIALEDKRFNKHQGVDWRRTAGAFFGMIGFTSSGTTTGGGSTITQQLVKNLTGEKEISIERKIKEIHTALEISKKFSKDEILEAYLNTIAFGNNTHGVEAAANLYFNKSASELGISEAAAIISITRLPSYYDPFKNPEENNKRRIHTINLMLEQGLINERQHQEAINEEPIFAEPEGLQKLNASNNWFVDYCLDSIVRDLMIQENITAAQAEAKLFRGGYRIFTTVDVQMQEYLESSFMVGSPAKPPVSNDEYPQGAFVILDHHGKILAMTGSNRGKNGDRLFNRATDAKRQPGSTLKPISAYLHAFQMNLIHWSLKLHDSPIIYKEHDQYPINHYPQNIGNITVGTAINRSTNTIPVKIIQEIGPLTAFNFLRDTLGFNALVEPCDIDLSPMALGGLSKGVSPLEITGAYQIFANGGYFTKPYAYTRVENAHGDIILQNDNGSTRVIDFETATIINKLLQDIVKSPYGTGTSAHMGHMPVAGKTGSSQGDRDQWFIGVTPYFVAGVWLGFDTPQSIIWEGFQYPPAVLWFNIMEPLHKDRGFLPKSFVESPNVVPFDYCIVSGALAGAFCATISPGWYNVAFMPGYCIEHRSVLD